jgi:hypothetical protein
LLSLALMTYAPPSARAHGGTDGAGARQEATNSCQPSVTIERLAPTLAYARLKCIKAPVAFVFPESFDQNWMIYAASSEGNSGKLKRFAAPVSRANLALVECSPTNNLESARPHEGGQAPPVRIDGLRRFVADGYANAWVLDDAFLSCIVFGAPGPAGYFHQSAESGVDFNLVIEYGLQHRLEQLLILAGVAACGASILLLTCLIRRRKAD